jgi:hypothetical protein
MRNAKYLFLAIVLAGWTQVAHGHGFSLSLSSNTLVGTSGDYPGNGNARLFNEQFLEILGEWKTEHGGAGTSLFGTNKELAFDVLGPLWYSTGGAAVPAPINVSLEMKDQQGVFAGPSITLDANSTVTAGYPISGNTSHEFIFTLDGAALHEGVYGIAYSVRGNPVGGNPYVPTQLLVATWMTPNFDPGEDPLNPESPLQMAQAAIFTAATAVPEPSSIVLSAICAGAMAGVAVRRRRRMSRAT